MTHSIRRSAEQIAQEVSDDFMLYQEPRIALAQRIKRALTAYADEKLEEAAKICDGQAAIHQSEGATTWGALAETYAEMIRTLKASTPAPGGAK